MRLQKESISRNIIRKLNESVDENWFRTQRIRNSNECLYR